MTFACNIGSDLALTYCVLTLMGCGTLNQPTMQREGEFVVGVGTTTLVEVPDQGESDVSQRGETWLRYALLERLEVYGQASFPDLGLHLGAKSLLLGDFDLFDDHSKGLLLAVDARAGYWPTGHPYGESVYDAQVSIPIGFAWSNFGFVSAAPALRLGWASGELENLEVGVSFGVAQSPNMGDVVLPPLGVELYGGRDVNTEVSVFLVRVSAQLPIF